MSGPPCRERRATRHRPSAVRLQSGSACAPLHLYPGGRGGINRTARRDWARHKTLAPLAVSSIGPCERSQQNGTRFVVPLVQVHVCSAPKKY